MSRVAKSVGNASVLVLGVIIAGTLWGYKIAWEAIFTGNPLAVSANCLGTKADLIHLCFYTGI